MIVAAGAAPSLPRPSAVIFDVFDTLFLNSPDEWVSLLDRTCSEQGLATTGAELWKVWKGIEVGFREARTNLEDPAKSPPFKSYERAWTECYRLAFDAMSLKGDPALAARRAVEHLGRRPIFPDTVPALRSLTGRVRLGVFSNADDAFLRPLLSGAGLRFDFVASSESAQVYKPSPLAFEHVLGAMGLDRDQAWYVGDQLLDDVIGAHGAGITAIWINRKGNSRGMSSAPLPRMPAGHTATPDATISDLRELLTLLDAAGPAEGARKGQATDA